MHRIGIEFISVFGLPPVEFVNLAANLGCHDIGMAVTPMPWNPLNYPQWNLLEDKKLRTEMKAVMKDRGVSISVSEGFMIAPNMDVRALAPNLDTMCEMGAKTINAISIDFDKGRSFDQFAVLAEMTGQRGVDMTVEYAPIMAIADLPMAVACVQHAGKPHFRVLIDTMHLVRAGAGAKEIAALDPNLIGYVQLCDVPAKYTMQTYGDEARFERLPPGEGDLPLFDIVKALPKDFVLGLEVPMQKEAVAAGGARKPLERAVAATRKLLTRLGR